MSHATLALEIAAKCGIARLCPSKVCSGSDTDLIIVNCLSVVDVCSYICTYIRTYVHTCMHPEGCRMDAAE